MLVTNGPCRHFETRFSNPLIKLQHSLLPHIPKPMSTLSLSLSLSLLLCKLINPSILAAIQLLKFEWNIQKSYESFPDSSMLHSFVPCQYNRKRQWKMHAITAGNERARLYPLNRRHKWLRVRTHINIGVCVCVCVCLYWIKVYDLKCRSHLSADWRLSPSPLFFKSPLFPSFFVGAATSHCLVLDQFRVTYIRPYFRNQASAVSD